MGQVMVAPRGVSAARRVGPGLYRKHALPITSFVYKDGRKIEVTPDFLMKMKANFDAKVRDSVPVPAKGAGGHSDDWRDSVGETVGFEVDPAKGAYVTIRVNEEADKAISEDRLKGVSLSFDPDWFDPRSGQKIGPVLRHTALTNIPYINGTEPFEAISLSEGDELVVLSLDPEDTSEAVVELYSDSQPPPPVDDAAEAAELLAEYFSVVALAEELKSTLNPPPVELYSDSQPRDSQGQWTSGFLGTGRSDGVTDDGLPPTVGPNAGSIPPSAASKMQAKGDALKAEALKRGEDVHTKNAERDAYVRDTIAAGGTPKAADYTEVEAIRNEADEIAGHGHALSYSASLAAHANGRGEIAASLSTAMGREAVAKKGQFKSPHRARGERKGFAEALTMAGGDPSLVKPNARLVRDAKRLDAEGITRW